MIVASDCLPASRCANGTHTNFSFEQNLILLYLAWS